MPPLYNLLFKLNVDIDKQREKSKYFKGLVEQAANIRGDGQVGMMPLERQPNVDVVVYITFKIYTTILYNSRPLRHMIAFL
jgi:hypothetical protein